MGKTITAGYTKLYAEFMAWQKPRITEATYNSQRTLVCRAIKWFKDENINIYKATVADVLNYT